MTYTFKLAKKARSGGGDRYHCNIGSDKPWVVYFPQDISRPNGQPLETLVMKVEPGLEE